MFCVLCENSYASSPLGKVSSTPPRPLGTPTPTTPCLALKCARFFVLSRNSFAMLATPDPDLDSNSDSKPPQVAIEIGLKILDKALKDKY
ncbi:hypothetical protein ACLKA6_003775 [Drosophila palustris]